MSVRLKSLIAPSFYELHQLIKEHKYTHYVLDGGRGSTKSSYISIEIVLGIVSHPRAHAIIIRKVGATLADSVYTQMLWAIDVLGLNGYFTATRSPLKIIYKPTGQTIMFRGADDPIKIKSVKAPFGSFEYIWFEEWDQFAGEAETRNILQSVMRGGDTFNVFYSFNPPESQRSWVNTEVRTERADRIVHHSTYLTVPKEWLGPAFIIEAEHLKKINPRSYAHEYLGEVTGTGGEIFRNVKLRVISDEEVERFDQIRNGLDWGFAVDPFAYVREYYDKARRRLYIFKEIYQVELSNRLAAEKLKPIVGNELVTCDSAEPKSVADLNEHGIKAIPARKGPGSIAHGVKWLQDLDEIIIDPQRCPNAAREFVNYEYEKDSNGNYKASYPDRDNHTIDATRYATEEDQRNVRVS